MCDSIMKTHLLEDKCLPCASPDGDFMRTAVKTKKKNCEDSVQNTEKQGSKNVKSKKSHLQENSSKKFKCEMKHEGSPANSILSTDNEEDREEGGFQNSETTEVDLMEREEEVQADTEEEAAEKAWENYIRDNHSVIISTFQGQFKSTVCTTIVQFYSIYHNSTSLRYVAPQFYSMLPITRVQVFVMYNNIHVYLYFMFTIKVCVMYHHSSFMVN